MGKMGAVTCALSFPKTPRHAKTGYYHRYMLFTRLFMCQ